MNLKDVLISMPDDFIFNISGIENFNNNHVRLRFWFEHCKKNINILDGNIFEFGVFQGSSLISMALLLKKLGSSKKIFGFDSFAGFPEFHEKDDFQSFYKYPDIFDKNIVLKHELMLKSKDARLNNIGPENISASGSFDDTSEGYVRGKIDQLGLDNIELIVGDFEDTVDSFFQDYSGRIFSCNLDCDLYLGYKKTLPYIYDKLVEGGFVHLDEYYSLKFPGARIACNEFFHKMGISPIQNSTLAYEFERWCIRK